MKMFIAISLLTLSLVSQAKDFKQRNICEGPGSMLKAAIMDGSNTATYEYEERILLGAIEATLRDEPNENNENFLDELNEIYNGRRNYSNTVDRVNFLLSQSQSALDNLNKLCRAKY
jgi:hypothetical protein